MTTIHIEATYNTIVTAKVQLPKGRTWGDVADWHIKFDVLYARFFGDEKFTKFELDSECTPENTNWARPVSSAVYAAKRDGSANYENQLEASDL